MLVLDNGRVEAVVDETMGMALESLVVDGMELVYFDEGRKKAGGTYGIPVLFPTPNRVAGDHFVFQGVEYPAVMHGFFRHAGLDVVYQDAFCVQAVLGLDGKNPLFPFEGRMAVTIQLIENGISWRFGLSNSGVRDMAFGLALHPFFVKEGLERVSCNTRFLMEKDENSLPTGKLVSKKDGMPDFSTGLAVKGLGLDDVFICAGSVMAELAYDCGDLLISGSKDFNHAVIYTKPDAAFFCLEPQTCSTDAHNLYDRGVAGSGLIVLPPGGVWDGRVVMEFKKR